MKTILKEVESKEKDKDETSNKHAEEDKKKIQ